jgi:hypothetical protein
MDLQLQINAKVTIDFATLVNPNNKLGPSTKAYLA